MTLNVILAILALLGCYSDRAVSESVQWSADYHHCFTETHHQFFNLECSDSNNRLISMYTIDHTLYVTHKGTSSIILELETFPKECFRSIKQELRGLRIENCTVPDGHSFGTLFEHLGIKDKLLAFEGVNIGPSLDSRFSSGFEKVENLTLRGNKIRRLNEHVFGSLTKLSLLDLSGNEISIIHRNVFKELTGLRKLKLYGNQLKLLYEGMFESQNQLEELLLDGNMLQKLTMEMFQGLDSLTVLSIEQNTLSNLTDDVFHNLPRLHRITLGNDNIRVPKTIFSEQKQLGHVFLEKVKIEEGLQLSGVEELKIKWSEVVNISGLLNIRNVSIINGNLRPLAVTTFNGLSCMKVLDLKSNKITNLLDGLFDGLTELNKLRLSKNHLTNISGLIFRDLQQLTEIDLSDNRLTTIHPNAFFNTTKLKIINLWKNQLSFNDNQLPFTHLYNLETLNLNTNKLTRWPYLTQLAKLKEVDLGFNEISSVKFSDIRHTFVNLSSKHETGSVSRSSFFHITYLNDNPLVCDCSIFDFLSGTVADQKHLTHWQVFKDRCKNDSVHLEQCHRESYRGEECPAECTCTERKDKTDLHILINCEGKGLTRVPEIKIPNATTIELDLSNNRLTELPLLYNNLNVTFIRASFNQISALSSENIPPKLRGLDLSNNSVETIAANVIHHLKNHHTLEIFFLKGNPLACHCFSNDDTVQFIEFVKDNSSITDLQGAKCNEINELTMEMLEEYCRNFVIIYSLVFVTILTLITGILSVLIIQHLEFIKIWLYANDWFLWWVDEEYMDRHKKYDVFISYANENRDLALYLLKVLEDCCLSYKFCEHDRDFVVGEDIEQSVVDAVKNSRRTMVILSENYLKSRWCTHEFHLAMNRSLNEKRKIIIAVKYGHLGNVAEVDKVIESYIKTHTYIESNDKYFWERILYALPHRKQRKTFVWR